MILNDKQLRESVIITPFSKKTGSPSRGCSSFGYDFTLSGSDFRIFRHQPGKIVDPINFDPKFLEPQIPDSKGRFILPAQTYALGFTTEYISVPNYVLGVFVGKSTYARCGIIVNVTPAEPGWHGHLTVEISNSSDSDAYVYANRGICQGLFFSGDVPESVYTGKYQGQSSEVTLSR